MVGMGGDVISELVHVGGDSVFGGVGFTVEEGDVLVVFSSVVPDV